MKVEITEEMVRAIEAMVMVAQEPVPTELIAQLLEVPSATVESVCAELAETYETAGHGFQMAKIAGVRVEQMRALVLDGTLQTEYETGLISSFQFIVF